MPRTATKTATTDTAAVDRFAPLTDDDIKELTDSGSFSRGRSYFRGGAIVDPVLTGETITAGCWGSEPYPYRVRATLARQGAKDRFPRDCDCTCPRGGFCKHIVALLLTWIDNPLAFEERPPLRESLAERSKDDLIAIIERLIEHDPELYRLVELPVVGGQAPGAADATRIDPASIRRQVDAIFRMPRRDDWYATSEIVRDLDGVLRIGQDFASAGAWAGAAVVYAAMTGPLLSQYNHFDDSEGDLASVIIECDRGLAQCLDAQATLAESDRLPVSVRRDVLQAIFDIWRFDVYESGGADLSQEGPEALARAATEAERDDVLAQIRSLRDDQERKPAPSDYFGDWQRRASVGFEVILKEEAGLAPEELLALYQDNEMWAEMAWLLLEQGQITDAVAVAGRHLTSANELLPFATAVRDLGGKNVETAIDLVDARLWEAEGKNRHDDEQLRAWLETTYAQHGSPEKALAIARRRFAAAPSFSAFQDVRKAATVPELGEGTWMPIRDELLTTLRDRKAWSDLIQIALDEGDLPAALAALAELEKTRTSPPALAYGWSTTSAWFEGIDIKVAEAAEATMPDEAIRIYRRAAGQAIEARGRGNYQQAAEYLARVRRILTANNRANEWAPIIAAIRTDNKRLRALMDELNARQLT